MIFFLLIKNCNLIILRQVYESQNIFALSIYHFNRSVFNMYSLKSEIYILYINNYYSSFGNSITFILKRYRFQHELMAWVLL